MSKLLRPSQLGYATPGGAEAAVHAARATIDKKDLTNEEVGFKADFCDAFNTLRRDKMLLAVKKHLPTYYNFICQMFRYPSHLSFGPHILRSQCGVQQGDPLGPLLFCLTIHNLVAKLKSPLNLWYLDDGTVAGDARTVANDLNVIIEEGKKIGLELNFSKCEIFRYGGENAAPADLQLVANAVPDAKVPAKPELTLLGSPLWDDAVPAEIRAKTAKLRLMTGRLRILPAHQALFLLKNCLSLPKLLYVLRTSRAWRFRSELDAFDQEVRASLSSITNTKLSDDAWCQASLPVACGGLGFRRTSELAFSAYLASVCSAKDLVSSMCPGFALQPIIRAS